MLIKGFLDRTENKWAKPIPSSWINLKNVILGEKKSSDERIPTVLFCILIRQV